MTQKRTLLSFEDEGFEEAQREARQFALVFLLAIFILFLSLVFLFKDITCMVLFFALALSSLYVLSEDTFSHRERRPQKQFIEVFSSGISRRVMSYSSTLLQRVFVPFDKITSIKQNERGNLEIQTQGKTKFCIYTKGYFPRTMDIFSTFKEETRENEP